MVVMVVMMMGMPTPPIPPLLLVAMVVMVVVVIIAVAVGRHRNGYRDNRLSQANRAFLLGAQNLRGAGNRVEEFGVRLSGPGLNRSLGDRRGFRSAAKRQRRSRADQSANRLVHFRSPCVSERQVNT